MLSSLLGGCSKGDTKSPLIIGGRVDSQETVDPQAIPHVGGAGDGADPAVVAVHSGVWLCTGTLIAPRFVLTAQHCVVDVGPRWVTFGLRSNEGPRTLVRVHLPPPSVGRTSDIAVLELAEASTITPTPVNLDAHRLDHLSTIRVVGYGVTGTDNHDSGIKRTVSVHATTTPSYVESVGTDGTCFGDSGGPALAVINGREQLVAVTSHGTTHSCEEGHGRYVRTDAHEAFLRRFVSDAAAPTPTPAPTVPSDSVAEQPQPTLPVPPEPLVPGTAGTAGIAGTGSGGTGAAGTGAAGTNGAGTNGTGTNGTGTNGTGTNGTGTNGTNVVQAANGVTIITTASGTIRVTATSGAEGESGTSTFVSVGQYQGGSWASAGATAGTGGAAGTTARTRTRHVH